MTMIEIGLDNRDKPKDIKKVNEYIKLYGLEALRGGDKYTSFNCPSVWFDTVKRLFREQGIDVIKFD